MLKNSVFLRGAGSIGVFLSPLNVGKKEKLDLFDENGWLIW
jgi:hypothetical protein